MPTEAARFRRQTVGLERWSFDVTQNKLVCVLPAGVQDRRQISEFCLGEAEAIARKAHFDEKFNSEGLKMRMKIDAVDRRMRLLVNSLSRGPTK